MNPVTGTDEAHTESFPPVARPLGVRRNSLKLPPFAAFDVRVLKSVFLKPHGKLDFVIEGFNVLNRQNVTQFNSVFGPSLTHLATFGRPIDAANARHIQFSIDFEF